MLQLSFVPYSRIKEQEQYIKQLESKKARFDKGSIALCLRNSFLYMYNMNLSGSCAVADLVLNSSLKSEVKGTLVYILTFCLTVS